MLRRTPSTPSQKAASWCTETARPSCISVLATASVSVACSTTPPRNATVTTEMDTTLLRLEGNALLDALEAAPGLRPALDLSSTAPGVQVPPGETAVVDDPRWAQT